MVGVSDMLFVTEFGVVDGVVDDGNAVETVSVSIFTGFELEKSRPRFMVAVVSVGWKIPFKLEYMLPFLGFLLTCVPGSTGIG